MTKQCCLCGQLGHLAKDCPAERWPRIVEGACAWAMIVLLSVGIGYTLVWMGMI